MFVEFPLDRESLAMDNQYMVGPALLVRPIANPLDAGGNKTQVYLPSTEKEVKSSFADCGILLDFNRLGSTFTRVWRTKDRSRVIFPCRRLFPRLFLHYKSLERFYPSELEFEDPHPRNMLTHLRSKLHSPAKARPRENTTLTAAMGSGTSHKAHSSINSSMSYPRRTNW